MPAYRPCMKSEQMAFGERLRTALKQAQLSDSPAELIKLLARHGGVPVSPQAVSGWLNGKSLPRQANMRALAKLLRVEPHQLQYGHSDGRKVRKRRARGRPATHWISTLSTNSLQCRPRIASWFAN